MAGFYSPPAGERPLPGKPRGGIGSAVAQRGRQGKPFTPYNPNQAPPAGTYDPNLDAQVRQVMRGLGDAKGDFQTANDRALQDYTLGQQNVGRSYQRGVEDLGSAKGQADTGYKRGLSDLLTERSRAGQDFATGDQRAAQDYGTNIGDLNRNYQRLGESQTQSAVASGASEGGALQAALAKRSENLAHDRAPLDTGYQRYQSDSAQRQSRFGEDSAQREQRMGQDYQTQLGTINRSYGRLGEDSTNALAGLALAGQRGSEDRTTNLSRAEREAGFFGADTKTQEVYQATHGGGWTNVKPKNEHIGHVSGTKPTAYRDIGKGMIMLPNGRIIKKPLGLQGGGHGGIG